MRPLLWALAAALVVLSSPAMALLDAASTVEQFEDPTGDPAKLNYRYNSSHTSAGLYQISVSTWNDIASSSNLPQVGPGTPYANVGALDAATQRDGFDALFQAQGFNPWTCPGCNPALADYIAAQGGPSAFTDDTSSSDLANSLAAGDGTPTAPDGTKSTTPAPGAATGWGLYKYIWDSYHDSVSTVVQQARDTIISDAYSMVGSIIVLAMLVTGVALMFGFRSWDEFWRVLMRGGVVISLLWGGSLYYTKMVVAFFTSFPDTAGQWLGIAGTGPEAFDQVVNMYQAVGNTALEKIPCGFHNLGPCIEGSLLLLAGGFITLISTTCMFLVYWLSQAILEIITVIGPILALAIVFNYFRYLWDGFIQACVHLALTAFTSVVLSSLLLTVITNLIIKLPRTSGDLEILESLFKVSFAVFAFAVAVVALQFILAHIARGAVGVAGVVWRHSGTSTVANAPSQAAGAAIGAAAAVPAAVVRMTAPPGRSLSR